jgi:chromosome segregation ATPase
MRRSAKQMLVKRAKGQGEAFHGGMPATGDQDESGGVRWEGTEMMVQQASKLTSQMATLLQLLQVASDGRDSAQARARALERKHKEQLAAIGASEMQRKGLEERMRMLQETAAASEGEVKALKRQLASVEARCVDRISAAGSAADRKMLALVEERQNNEAALQKTIRELQRTIETKKTVAAQAQQKLHEAEARASAAESKLAAVTNKIHRLESSEANAKREAAEARRGRERSSARRLLSCNKSLLRLKQRVLRLMSGRARLVKLPMPSRQKWRT